MIPAGCLEVLSRVASRSVRVASRSHRGLPRGLREQTLRPKFSILGVFLALPTETSFTTPHYYPKYEVRAIEFFVVVGSLSYQFLVFRMKKAL